MRVCVGDSVSSEIRQCAVKTTDARVQMIANNQRTDPPNGSVVLPLCSPIWERIMTLRPDCKGQLLLTMTIGLGTLLSAATQSALKPAAACSAGPRLCYDTPVNAGPLINTALFEGGPSLSQDGLTLLFGAARRNSLGVLDEDIYMATRETTAEAFGPAHNLGATVNALGFGDYSPELSVDGLTLYFSSSRPGGQGEADLYVTTRASIDDPWEPPQNLGPGVNSAYF